MARLLMNVVVFGLAAAVLYQLKTLFSHGAAIAIDTPAAGSQRLNRAAPGPSPAAPGAATDLHAEVSALLAASSAISVDALERVLARHRASGGGETPAASNEPCEVWGCSCQGFSDRFHAVHQVTFGSATEPQRQWWVKQDCHTRYAGE